MKWTLKGLMVGVFGGFVVLFGWDHGHSYRNFHHSRIDIVKFNPAPFSNSGSDWPER